MSAKEKREEIEDFLKFKLASNDSDEKRARDRWNGDKNNQ